MDPASRKRERTNLALAALFLALGALTATQDMTVLVPILFVLAGVAFLVQVGLERRRRPRA